jgi:hypothetical protein
VAFQPHNGTLQGTALKLTAHHAAGFFPLDESGVLQNAKMLDEARQRHAERLGELADRALSAAEPRKHRAPRGVGERAEDCVEPGG